MKTLLSVAASALVLTTLVGCSGDDGGTAKDPAAGAGSTQTTEPTASPTVGTYPELEAQDYTYVLEQQCFCPLAGPVRITVEDGKVTSSVVVKGGYGVKKGSEAPEYLWVTINDVIAHANDTKAAKVDVDWPEGQDWPSSVAVDHDVNAVDDEVSYIVKDVEIQS
ncbi:DUF6174 domain-containing protein [Nocardioides sp. MH1]|uniref:DUF6174 domain-containing protein n=1 Tax=Nocardioides sp. MH1 TaxID=3242490 RepID=UPI003520E274